MRRGEKSSDPWSELAGQIAFAAGLDASKVSIRELAGNRFVARVKSAESVGTLDQVLTWALDAAKAALWQ